MFNKIYRRKEYIIFRVRNGYIVQNTKNKFEEGHTHIKNYNKAKKLIDLSIKNEMPRNTKNTYILESLYRISNNVEYKERIKNEQEKTNNNKHSYGNNVVG